MFVLANQQGQGKGWSRGRDRQRCFGVLPGAVLAWANWAPWLMGAGNGTTQGWLLDAAALYPPPSLGMCTRYGAFLSKGTLLQ